MAPVRFPQPRPVAAYVGTYINAFFGDVKVTATGGVLNVEIGPRHDQAVLKH